MTPGRDDNAYRSAAESPLVRRFRLDPVEYRRVLKRTVWLRLLGMAATAVLASSIPGLFMKGNPSVGRFALPLTIAVSASFAALLIASVKRMFARVQAGQFAGYELLLSSRVLRRAHGTGVPAEVLRPEVTRVVETRDGLWVTSDRPERALFVTRAVDGFADVREALANWRRIEPLEGFAALAFTWRHARNEGSRDARRGTALATDPTLFEDLAAVRAASGDRGAGLGGPIAVPSAKGVRKMLLLWGVLVAIFLVIWEFLRATTPWHAKATRRATPGVVEPDVSDVSVFDTRTSRIAPRTRAVLVTEISGLENTFENIPRDAPERPALARRIAEDYGELESAARGEEALAEAERDGARVDQAEGIVTRARTRVERWYSLLAKEYPGDPSIEEVFFYLGYEYQLGGEMDQARRVYFQLIQKVPESRYVPIAYLSFGELFFDEARMDPARWDLAAQAYAQVIKYPPEGNPAYGYAWYKLGYVLWNQRKLTQGIAAFRKAIEYATTCPRPLEAHALEESAKRNVVVLTKLAATASGGGAR